MSDRPDWKNWILEKNAELDKEELSKGLSDPSQYKTPESLSEEEVFAAVRQDIIAELDAINLYEAHKAATKDKELIKILDHIIEEEKDHFVLLQNYLKKHDQLLGKHGPNYKV